MFVHKMGYIGIQKESGGGNGEVEGGMTEEATQTRRLRVSRIPHPRDLA